MKTADFGAGAKTELGQTRLFGGIELDAGDRGAGAGLKIRETAERFLRECCSSFAACPSVSKDDSAVVDGMVIGI